MDVPFLLSFQSLLSLHSADELVSVFEKLGKLKIVLATQTYFWFQQ